VALKIFTTKAQKYKITQKVKYKKLKFNIYHNKLELRTFG